MLKRLSSSNLIDRHSISEKEKRKGMRYALRKFQRSCAGCSNVPTDMKNTCCGVCGQFSFITQIGKIVMANEIEKVVAGFTQLTDQQRTLAIELLNEYINADTAKRRILKEDFSVRAGLDLGPTNQGGCPCCGK